MRTTANKAHFPFLIKDISLSNFALPLHWPARTHGLSPTAPAHRNKEPSRTRDRVHMSIRRSPLLIWIPATAPACQTLHPTSHVRVRAGHAFTPRVASLLSIRADRSWNRNPQASELVVWQT